MTIRIDPTPPGMTRTAAGTTAALLLLLASGCTPFNERAAIGQGTEIDPINQTGQAPAITTTDDPPSITSLDRSGWTKQTFLVPVDGAGHQPTGRHDYSEVKFTDRQKGIYPTAETALDLDGKPEHRILSEEITESVGGPIVGVYDVVTMPFRLIFDPPTRLRRSPGWDYERWPGTSTRPPASDAAVSMEPESPNGPAQPSAPTEAAPVSAPDPAPVSAPVPSADSKPTSASGQGGA